MSETYDAEADSWGSWKVAIEALRERHLMQSAERGDCDNWRSIGELVPIIIDKLTGE